jgi:hypothetical protein
MQVTTYAPVSRYASPFGFLLLLAGLLDVHWPTSATTQVLHNVDANQVIEVTGSAVTCRKVTTTPIAVPRDEEKISPNADSQ